MKKIFLLLVATVIIIGISGYQNSDHVKSKKVALEYMNSFYTINNIFQKENDDQFIYVSSLEKIMSLKHIITDRMTYFLSANRITDLLYESATTLNSNFQIEELELELMSQDDKGVIFYTYEMTIKFTSLDNDIKYENFEGQIRLVKEEGTWKVDLERPTSFKNFLPEK